MRGSLCRGRGAQLTLWCGVMRQTGTRGQACLPFMRTFHSDEEFGPWEGGGGTALPCPACPSGTLAALDLPKGALPSGAPCPLPSCFSKLSFLLSSPRPIPGPRCDVQGHLPTPSLLTSQRCS